MTSLPPIKTSSSSSWAVGNSWLESPGTVEVVVAPFFIIDEQKDS
jgi:hypothetical protein